MPPRNPPQDDEAVGFDPFAGGDVEHLPLDLFDEGADDEQTELDFGQILPPDSAESIDVDEEEDAGDPFSDALLPGAQDDPFALDDEEHEPDHWVEPPSDTHTGLPVVPWSTQATLPPSDVEIPTRLDPSEAHSTLYSPNPMPLPGPVTVALPGARLKVELKVAFADEVRLVLGRDALRGRVWVSAN